MVTAPRKISAEASTEGARVTSERFGLDATSPSAFTKLEDPTAATCFTVVYSTGRSVAAVAREKEVWLPRMPFTGRRTPDALITVITTCIETPIQCTPYFCYGRVGFILWSSYVGAKIAKSRYNHLHQNGHAVLLW